MPSVEVGNQRAIRIFTDETCSCSFHHELNLYTTQKSEILTPPVADPGFFSGGKGTNPSGGGGIPTYYLANVFPKTA